MDLNSTSSATATALNAAQSASNVGDKRAQLTTMLLRKALDAQQGEAAALLNQFQGKGQNLDVRV